MTLKDSIQTAFLVVGIFTILAFGASYYFMFLDANPTDQPLKDSLAITASFFGGFATLTAAYIASKLFNHWKEQHNKNIDVKYIDQIIRNFEDFDLMFSRQYIPIQDLFYEMQENKTLIEINRRNLIYENLKTNLPELHISFLTLTRSIQTLAIINNNFIETVDSLKVYKSAFKAFQQKVLDSGYQQTSPNMFIIFHAFREFQDSLVELERNFIIKKTESLKEK